jgi:cytochrome oxidase Cu insertion factor (SCO1/SenC/PrrC family)
MKRFPFPSLLLVLLLLCLPIAASAQSAPGPKDGADLKPADLERIKTGVEAPDFTLEDADGAPVTLSRYRDRKSVVLVFYRGYW